MDSYSIMVTMAIPPILHLLTGFWTADTKQGHQTKPLYNTYIYIFFFSELVCNRLKKSRQNRFGDNKTSHELLVHVQAHDVQWVSDDERAPIQLFYWPKVLKQNMFYNRSASSNKFRIVRLTCCGLPTDCLRTMRNLGKNSEELWLGASWTMGIWTGQRGMGQRQSTH